MACFHPVEAWQLESGTIVFAERGNIRRALVLPCGRCIGCRLVRARSWAIRCVHEARMHPVNCFVTLTYDNDHFYPSLNYRDFQLFMYRVRQKLGPTRFFMCGEYGEINLRPHFHALLFGRSFSDGVPCGKNICSSKTLSSLWRLGFASFGDVSYDSAAYVARYSCKKVTGERAEAHYRRVDPLTGEVVQCVPEFGRMSLRPGIGATWLEKNWRDVYVARDGIVERGGKVVPPPRFYDKLLGAKDDDLLESKKLARYERSFEFDSDGSPTRLAVREKCALAKQRFLKRNL